MTTSSPAIRLVCDEGVQDLSAFVSAHDLTIDMDGEEVINLALGVDVTTWAQLLDELNQDKALHAAAYLLPPYRPDDVIALKPGSYGGLRPTWVHLDGTRDSRPIIEKIAQAIEYKLTTVRSALESPNQTITVHRPARLADISIQHLAIVMVSEDAAEHDERPHQMYEEVHTFGVFLFVVPSDSSTTPVDMMINQFRADVTCALMEDPRWGGLAVDTYIRPPDIFPIVAGEYTGCMLPVDVQYRTNLNNPYTL